jgi:flagellar motor switch protein FliM
VQIKPLRGTSLFIIDPSLVFAVVDNMFGGDGRFHTRVEGRDFTPTEQRIIHKMLMVIFEDYGKSWSPVYPINFEYVRSEMHTQFANIATPSEIVLATSFNIELGSAGGQLHICIPYASVEPIRDLLYSSMQGDHIEPDKRWMRMLSKQVQFADVELVAKLTTAKLTVHDILNMQVGDVISTNIQPTITAEVDGVPLFECRYGVMNGQYAIKIEKTLAINQQENQLGEDHV